MRPVSEALQTAVVQPVVRHLMLVRFNFDSGVVAWNSGFTDIVYNGATYRGIGVLGSVSPVKEQPGIKAASVTISISGLKPEISALVQTEKFQNRKALIHVAVTDESYSFDPQQVSIYFLGKIDDIQGAVGKAGSFTISVRSRLADWERVRNLKYTDADQQQRHPGDKGMEFIAQLSQRKIIWPRAEFLPDPRD